jgi:hypothetical protein
MGRSFSTLGEKRKSLCLRRKPHGKKHLEDLDIGGRMKLKWILEK